jgi:hypothetical protein
MRQEATNMKETLLNNNAAVTNKQMLDGTKSPR